MRLRPQLTWIAPWQKLPPAQRAMRSPNGLLAAGSDLSAERLIEAYSHGIFPWYSDGQPVLWWSPDPRMVLFTEEFKLSRSLAKTLRRVAADGTWRLSFDHAFERVMRECAAPRPGQGGTWITDDIVAAYCDLHARQLAHSVEVWEGEELVGGLYGVSLGLMFYGESMFARRTDASKVALATWVTTLHGLGFRVIDCQQNTSHLASLGGREIDRETFLHHVARQSALSAPQWAEVSFGFPPV